MQYANRLHQQLLDQSTVLRDDQEADSGIREVAELRLAEQGLLFTILRDIESSKSQTTKHSLDFRTYELKNVLGIEMPPVWGTVCMAWEKPDNLPHMLQGGQFHNAVVKELVALLVTGGLLTDSSTANDIKPIAATLEHFAALHDLLEPDQNDEQTQRGGEALVAESNQLINAVGEVV